VTVTLSNPNKKTCHLKPFKTQIAKIAESL